MVPRLTEVVAPVALLYNFGRLWLGPADVRLRSSVAEYAERWPQSNTNDHSIDGDERFLIPLWNHPSFFSRSSVDSSDVSLQDRS